MNNPTPHMDTGPDIQIADRVMNALIIKGVNLKALSQATGISYSTLRRSLHQDRPDRRSFNFHEFHQIADALNVEPSVLLPDTLATRSEQ